MNKLYIYGVQILFVCSIAVGSQSVNLEDKFQLLNIARYVIYLLTIKSIPHLCRLIHKYPSTQLADLQKAAVEGKEYLITYLCSTALLVYNQEGCFKTDFVYVCAAYLVVKYPQMAKKPSINYGVGMACSFFEGYLMHILPSDGAKFVGFEESMRILESREGVLFPVKKLFIIITKNLFCPPDLKEFNKGTDVPYLESFNFLDDVVKSVAGVKNRIYRNTTYKVNRGAAPALCLAAECATPLHTLHRVLDKRTLYQEVADIEVSCVVEDFCRTLRSILDKSPECRGKCELVYYDNEDPSQNLAQILVERVRELAPDFEKEIIARRNENIFEEPTQT